MINKITSATALVLSVVAISMIFFQKKDKVGYVYNSRVLNEYKGVVEARMQYQSEINQWQANLDTISFQLNDEVKKLDLNKGMMPNNEIALTQELINRKKQELFNYKKALEEKAAEKDAEMTKSVLNQIDSYLLEYGKKNGYKYLFGVTDNGNILYADEADDITDIILKELNKKYEGS